LCSRGECRFAGQKRDLWNSTTSGDLLVYAAILPTPEIGDTPMKKFLIPATCVFLSMSGAALAQDNTPTTPGDCSAGGSAECSTSPNAPTDPDTDINTNTGGTGTNDSAPDDQPTGASPVNPATNPSGGASGGSSGGNSGGGSSN
jgi:hypothetical protein